MGRGISAGTMGIAVVAILAGLVGAYIVRANLMKEEVVAAEPPAPMTLPLAASDLPTGRTLALGDIGLVRLTRAEVEERGYDLTKMMAAPTQIIGRTLREPVRQGQPFLTTGMYLQGTGPDFTSSLKPGFRAVSLQLPRDRGGALPTGSFVDVVFRSTEQRAEPGKLGIPEVTVRLLEGVEIIHVAEPATTQTNAAPTVSLAVTPEQAEILQTTTGRGEIAMVARPRDERVMVGIKAKPRTLEDVLGIERPVPQQVVLFATEIYRRGQRSVNVYRDDKLVEQMRAADAAAPVEVTPLPPADDAALPPAPAVVVPKVIVTPAPPAPLPPVSDDPFAPDPPARPAPAPAPAPQP